jgi:hypothetical protein
MTYGLQTTNTGGNVVIDSTYRNLVLRQKTTFSITPTTQSSGVVSIDVGRQNVSFANASSPVICLNSDTPAGLSAISISGSTYTWTISANNQCTVTAYIFDVPVTTTSTYGLKVFDASSNLVFNSDYKYMKVVDFFNLDYNFSGTTPTVTRSYSSGTYAVCVGNPRTQSTALPFSFMNTDGISCTSTSITVTAFGVTDLPAYAAGMGNKSGSGTTNGLTIDVTGY